MRRFLTLVHKEWRDVRTLTWVSMALVVVNAALVRWYVTDSFSRGFFSPDARRYLQAFVPVVVALYGALIASDRVGGEVASKRMDALALLPVGPSRLWAAKTVHVLAATVLFAIWTVAVQAAVLEFGDGSRQAGPFLEDAQRNLWVAAPVAGAVLCVLFASALGLSGIAALLVGGMLAGIVVGAANYIPYLLPTYNGSDAPRGWRGWIDPGRSASVGLLALVVPCLLASWAMFAGGRLHLGRWLRSGAIGACVFVGMLSAPAAVVAHEATTLNPGTGTARVDLADASPDGRYVAMFVLNRAAFGVVILDLRTGTSREQPGAMLSVPIKWNAVNWQPDGSLRCELLTPSSEQIDIDPTSGRVAARRARPPRDRGREERARLEAWKADRWVVRSQTVVGPPSAKRYRASLGRGDHPATVDVESETWVNVSDDGRAALFCPERGRVVMRVLPDGPDRTVFERGGAFVGAAQSFHGGRTLYVRSAGSAWIIDVESGAAHEVSVQDGDTWPLPTTRGSRRLVAIPTPRPDDAFAFVLYDMDTGAKSAPMAGSDLASELPDGRLLLHRSGTSVVILGPDLRVERVLVGEE